MLVLAHCWLCPIMAFIRSVLSHRPLLAHATFGAASAMTLAAIAPPLFDEEGEGGVLPPPGVGPAVPPPPPQGGTHSAAELAAAGLVGALQGSVMRFWYPAVEGFAHRHSTSVLGRRLLKIAVDATPALASTVVVNTALRAYYKRAYGLPITEERLFDRYWELADRVAAALSGAVSDMGGFDDSEFALIEAIIDTTPTLANAVTAAVSALNFTLVPRQFRGLVGTLQWQCYESLQAAALSEQYGDEEGGEPPFDSSPPPPEEGGGGGGGGGSLSAGGQSGGAAGESAPTGAARASGPRGRDSSL